MRPPFEDIYLRLAFDLARRSTCERLQVGCVITTDTFRQVVAIGFNGGPAGGRNACKRDDQGHIVPGQCQHLHAEINAIISCTHIGPKVVFVTHQPCEMCAIALVNLSAAAGPIRRVLYACEYRNTEGLEILSAAQIPVQLVHPA